MSTDKKILVIDDDKNVLLSTVCFLEDEGYQVGSAESAEAALKMVDEEAFDVAVVDMRLPGMDGNDFIREASKKGSGLQFIVLTGSAHYSIPPDFAQYKIGQDQVLHKPLLEMSIITDAIRKLTGED